MTICETEGRPSSWVDVKLLRCLSPGWRSRRGGWVVSSGDDNGGDGDIVSKDRCLELL